MASFFWLLKLRFLIILCNRIPIVASRSSLLQVPLSVDSIPSDCRRGFRISMNTLHECTLVIFLNLNLNASLVICTLIKNKCVLICRRQRRFIRIIFIPVRHDICIHPLINLLGSQILGIDIRHDLNCRLSPWTSTCSCRRSSRCCRGFLDRKSVV